MSAKINFKNKMNHKDTQARNITENFIWSTGVHTQY